MQTMQTPTTQPEPPLNGPVIRMGQKTMAAARKVKRALVAPVEFSYPGAEEDGKYFAEVYLTWFFGRGTIMWRARFSTPEAAAAAAKEHAVFLDSQLPRVYWAEDWSGRPYKERHEYGISYGAGEVSTRNPEDLVAVLLRGLPGYEASF